MKVSPQVTHFVFLIRLCTLFTWLRSAQWLIKVFSHRSHFWRWWTRWTRTVCDCFAAVSIKASSQWSHLNGFSPLWRRMCLQKNNQNYSEQNIFHGRVFFCKFYDHNSLDVYKLLITIHFLMSSWASQIWQIILQYFVKFVFGNDLQKWFQKFLYAQICTNKL